MPTPRGTKTATVGSTSMVKTVPNESPSRMSTQAPKIRPWAMLTNLSQGSVCTPRVAPRRALNGDVVLDRAEVGQAERGHLVALPVLLEPAAAVLVEGEADDEQAGDGGRLDRELGRHHWPLAA